MQKKFLFHPSIFLVNQVIIFSSYILIAACWTIPYLFDGLLRYHLFRIALYLSLTILFGIYFLKVIFYELGNTVYILNEDKLIKKSPAKTTIILFSEIINFRYLRLPVGLGIIKGPKKSIRFPFFIENLSELIQSIMEILKKEGKQAAFNEIEINRFKHKARIADFNLRQTYTVITPFFYTVLLFLFLSSITTFTIWRPYILQSLAWILFSFIFPLLGHLSATFYIARKISSQLKQSIDTQPSCDTARIYSITAIITGVLYLICGILFKSLYI